MRTALGREELYGTFRARNLEERIERLAEQSDDDYDDYYDGTRR